MEFSQTLFLCVQFSIQGEVAGDGETNGDAWDATDVLAHDFGLLKTNRKTKFTTCMCEAADELL